MISYELEHEGECRRLRVFAQMIANMVHGPCRDGAVPRPPEAHRCPACRSLILTADCLACDLRKRQARRSAAGLGREVLP